MLNSFSYSLPEELASAVKKSLDRWRKDDMVARIWARDASVWTNSDEAKWLGWLDVAGKEANDLQKFRDFAAEAAQFDDVVLLGMGGSSLCPEVFAVTFGIENFHVLDSTVPAQVKTLDEKLDPVHTLFIVASKSGSTLEPNCFKQYFYQRVVDTVGKENAGRHFVAITDPGSKMQQVAESDNFSRIFFGDPEIGGRFSALSVFGLAAAAAMQLDVEQFLTNTREMVDECSVTEPADNAGAVLGTILGVCQQNGRDKLTIFTSPEIYDVAAWMEQLVAESTGKNGVSIIPVAGEPVQEPEYYSPDRVFAYLKLKDAAPDEVTAAAIGALRKSGHPFITIEVDNKLNLGQEFFRWEFATAVAGAIMRINPFDQPDVESAKIEARKITDEYEQTGALPPETPFFESGGCQLFTSDEYAAELTERADEMSVGHLLEAHFGDLNDDDYFALLGYIEMNEKNGELLTEIRTHVADISLAATCLGFGPRFLHSTGQAYKGGANNGVFLQITSDDEIDVPVPGQKYSFGVVKAAQARGDFQVLLDRGRRALRVHVNGDVETRLREIIDTLQN